MFGWVALGDGEEWLGGQYLGCVPSDTAIQRCGIYLKCPCVWISVSERTVTSAGLSVECMVVEVGSVLIPFRSLSRFQPRSCNCIHIIHAFQPAMIARSLRAPLGLKLPGPRVTASLARRAVTTDAASSHAEKEHVPAVSNCNLTKLMAGRAYHSLCG